MKLMRLESQARPHLTDEFRNGRAGIDVSKYTKPFDREINLEPLENLIERTMEKFASMPNKSDGWLAPRVHATLRLTRREAADPQIWDYLAVVVVPDYVRWRWKREEGITLERFVGAEYRHAIARLWWGAEFARNGESYNDVWLLYEQQELQASYARYALFHHQPAVLGLLRFLSKFDDGKFAQDDQIRTLVPAFNMALTTSVLDSLAPNPPQDVQSVIEWCGKAPDETRMFDELPAGPRDNPVPEDAILAVVNLLERVARATTFVKRARSKPKVEEPNEAVAAAV